MNALDDLDNTPDPNTVSPMKTGLKYGIILVLAGIVFQLISSLLGWSDGQDVGMAFLSGIISLAITIGVIMFAVRFHRDEELGGFISFRRGMEISFWMGMSYGIVVGIWSWFYNNILAPESQDLQKREIDKIRAQVEDGEVPEEMLVYSEWIFEATNNPIFMMTMALLSILIIGLFVSLFAKRERPVT